MRKQGKGRYALGQTVVVMHGLEGTIEGLISRAKRESLTHAEMLADRKRVLFDDPRWARLPGWAKGELLACWRGAERALHGAGLIRWTHRIAGEIVTSDQVAGRWEQVTSSHEWVHSGRSFNDPVKTVG